MGNLLYAFFPEKPWIGADQDGGLPFDIENVFVQYRTNLPTPQDVTWQTFTSPVDQVGGMLMFDDTNTVAQIRRFYRILEQ